MTTLTVTCPVTGSHIGDVPAHSPAATRDAFSRARLAQQSWSTTPVSQRKQIMLRLHDLLLERQAEFLDIIQDETGKNRGSAFDEVLDVAVTARHYAHAAPRLLRPRQVRGAVPLLTRTHVERAPVGVVGIIAPWNYPLSLALSDAIPALLAGNAVVLKPDEKTPFTALLAADLLAEAGLPDDVLQVLTGTGPVVGDTIARECDYLMFTGSTAVGRELGAIAGQRLIGFSAELGGKNPLIVLPSADVARTARGAVAACFANSGQLCISIERIYVHRDIADDFIPAFVEATEAMRIGPGHEWSTDMGSLISPEHRLQVEELVSDALSRGATLLTGGRALDELGPAFYSPTILTDVPTDAHLFGEETFGPVVALTIVDSVDEAVARANESPYGLNASVWGDVAEARRVASRLKVGTVNINEGFAAAWASLDAPMGGWGQSGVGRRHGDSGLLKYTEARTVAVQRGVALSGSSGVPRERYAQVVSTALRYGRALLR
ncbi:succinic semialdehyde dehydrogenase [Corynebacterium sp. YIM 101645]|uniref:Aldehyde dehydrogenase n=1 Tax=Corynebacterium lemuris TaxID=1859292 RepID=A0ABT2FVL1_9CORY|nr:succinic semialdehyde dehydrogenase [Corynebacterium lemuris]MCS5478087.1 succinic semialdehyde dehydrogenase [Corynebacterium lemuris]